LLLEGEIFVRVWLNLAQFGLIWLNWLGRRLGLGAGWQAVWVTGGRPSPHFRSLRTSPRRGRSKGRLSKLLRLGIGQPTGDDCLAPARRGPREPEVGCGAGRPQQPGTIRSGPTCPRAAAGARHTAADRKRRAAPGRAGGCSGLRGWTPRYRWPEPGEWERQGSGRGDPGEGSGDGSFFFTWIGLNRLE